MNKPFSRTSPHPAPARSLPDVGRAGGLLLIGPTGSGKTPLGEALAARGLRGGRCLHFDFGAELRRAAPACPPDGREGAGRGSGLSDRSDLSEDDRTFIRRVLEEGALLEPEDFPVAARLLTAFLARHQARPDDLLVLNGLPRHVEQAEAIGDYADVRAVIELRCTPETVLERIRRNRGGDREGRADDDETMVRRKLRLYDQCTAPLLDFYRSRRVPVRSFEVEFETTGEEIAGLVEGQADVLEG